MTPASHNSTETAPRFVMPKVDFHFFLRTEISLATHASGDLPAIAIGPGDVRAQFSMCKLHDDGTRQYQIELRFWFRELGNTDAGEVVRIVNTKVLLPLSAGTEGYAAPEVALFSKIIDLEQRPFAVVCTDADVNFNAVFDGFEGLFTIGAHKRCQISVAEVLTDANGAPVLKLQCVAPLTKTGEPEANKYVTSYNIPLMGLLFQ